MRIITAHLAAVLMPAFAPRTRQWAVVVVPE